MTVRPNTKELTMDFTWFTNTQFNGWINSRLATSICYLKFRSNLNCTESLISQAPMRKNINQFLICGMIEERPTLTILIKSSNTEWTKLQNWKKKSKQLWEWQMSWKHPSQLLKLSTPVPRIQNMLLAPWLKSCNRCMNPTIWPANWSMDFHTFTGNLGTDLSNISTTEDCSATFHPTTLLTAGCLWIWTVIS